MKMSHFRDVLPSQSLSMLHALKKLKIKQQKQKCTNKPKDNITQNKYKLKSCLIALSDVRPEIDQVYFYNQRCADDASQMSLSGSVDGCWSHCLTAMIYCTLVLTKPQRPSGLCGLTVAILKVACSNIGQSTSR